MWRAYESTILVAATELSAGPPSPEQQPADGGSSSTLGAVTATLSGAGQAISNTATNAYNNAPDLGITRTFQSTYNSAPDMGVSQGAEKLTAGAGGASSSGGQNGGSSGESKEGGDETAEDGVSRSRS